MIWKIENVVILKERERDNLGIPKMGNSLNEVLPFLLGDGKFSGNPDLDIWKCWRHLENRDARKLRRSEKSEDSENWGREILGDAQILRFREMAQSPRFLSTLKVSMSLNSDITWGQFEISCFKISQLYQSPLLNFLKVSIFY